jgi:hypothetical protein
MGRSYGGCKEKHCAEELCKQVLLCGKVLQPRFGGNKILQPFASNHMAVLLRDKVVWSWANDGNTVQPRVDNGKVTVLLVRQTCASVWRGTATLVIQ